MAKAIPANRALPKKESDLFRQILKNYETKQYKKVVKAADTILKKFPEHGETLAMKGLTLNSLDKKEEGLDLVKRGLKADLRSHVCWHVYGLIHKAERNYEESVKCYLNALRIEPENMQILRDLSSLQVQIRELKGFVECRRQILSLKSNSRPNWMCYAVANHLNGDYDTAIAVLDGFLQSIGEQKEMSYEHSELLMYRNQVLVEAGKYTEALDHLQTIKPEVMDVLSWREAYGALLLLTGEHKKALTEFRELMERMPDNYRFHNGLQCAALGLPPEACLTLLHRKSQGTALPSSKVGLTAAQVATLTDLYQELSEQFPGSMAVQRIPLTFLTGDSLITRLTSYIHKYINKGVPSLGSDLSSLFTVAAGANQLDQPHPVRVRDPFHCRNHHVVEAVDAIATEAVAKLKAGGSLSEGGKDPKAALIWAMSFKTQMLERKGMYQEALALAEECIELSKETPELHHRKARILKKMGAYSAAADVMEECRKLDKGDRYLNNKSAKYLLRSDRVPEAEKTVALFTRHEGDPQRNLFEMQCSWYELAWAESQLRMKKYGPALKKAVAVCSHFEDFVEDQFDFHTYCMRKMTIRAYIAMLRMEDNIYGHAFYCRAAAVAVRAYLALHENPPTTEESAEVNYDNMSSAERKKAKAKARKEAKKRAGAEAEAEAKAAAKVAAEEEADNAAKAAAENGTKPPKKRRGIRSFPEDTDPNGKLLLEKDPLPEAAKYAKMLTIHASSKVETHVLAFEVAYKRGKPLMALRALVRGRALQDDHPSLQLQTAQLYHALSTGQLQPSPIAAALLAEEGAALLGSSGAGDVASFVKQFVDRATTLGGLADRVAAAQASYLLSQGDASVAAGAEMITGGLGSCGVSVVSCEEALMVLQGGALGEKGQAAAQGFKQACCKLFPLAPVFSS
ncbi:unnamed protein product [Chrysoparadoxa australica]